MTSITLKVSIRDNLHECVNNGTDYSRWTKPEMDQALDGPSPWKGQMIGAKP